MNLPTTSVTLRSPPRSEVLLFDATNSSLLKETVLRDIPHEVLETRLERIYFSPRVLFGMIAAIFKMQWKYIFQAGHILRRLRGEIYTLYLYACVKAVRPKVVITFIDNSIHFQAISRKYPGAKFFAIQNGVRSEFNLAHDLVPAPHPANRISMPFLFCFGDYEPNMYRRFGHSVDHFEPVGSVKAGYYLSNISHQRPAIEFDLCVASQWVDDVMLGSEYPEIKRSIEGMDGFVQRYLGENPTLTICIAMRQNHPAEEAYFQNAYGSRATLVARHSDGYSSYSAVDRSNVTLVLDSTIGREAYGWGKKVLFCNFTGLSMYDTDAHDWCIESRADYKYFSQKLGHLLNISEDDFLRSTAESRVFLMHGSSEFPAHLAIEARIKAELQSAAA